MGSQPLTTRERLQRKGQRLKSTRAQPPETPISNLIVIGTSAGGHNALIEVVRAVSTDIPAALVIIYHSAVDSPFKLEKWLSRFTRLPVVKVVDKERLRDGVIFVPSSGESLSIEPGLLLAASPRRGIRPITTINDLFKAAAKAYGRRVIDVILTGLLKDGTVGLKEVHNAGGLTIVQDPEEAEFGDMPASAMKDLPVTFCLNLVEIGPTLDLLARRNARLETGTAVSIRTLKERAALLVRLMGQSKQNMETYQFLSEELIDLKHDLRLIERFLHEVLLKGTQLRGKKILNKILQAAIKLTSADKGNIQLLDPISKTLRIVAQKGFEQPFLDFFAHVGLQEAAVCGTALRFLERVIVEDVTKSQIFRGTPALGVLLDAGVRAVHSTPLITGTGHVIGMISIHYRTPWHPTPQQLAQLDQLLAKSVDILEALQLRMGTSSSDI